MSTESHLLSMLQYVLSQLNPHRLAGRNILVDNPQHVIRLRRQIRIRGSSDGELKLWRGDWFLPTGLQFEHPKALRIRVRRERGAVDDDVHVADHRFGIHDGESHQEGGSKLGRRGR